MTFADDINALFEDKAAARVNAATAPLKTQLDAKTATITALTTDNAALVKEKAAQAAKIKALEARIKELEDGTGGPSTPPPDDPTPPPDEEPETPPVEPGAFDDIFYRRERFMKLPTSGAAFTLLEKRAKGKWEAPDFTGEDDSNNAQGDADALAGALYAERMNDDTMREKVRAHLRLAAKSEDSDWLLGLGRQLAGWVEAANLIRFAEPEFVNWVHRMITHKHGPGDRWGGYETILENAHSLNSNWAVQCNRSVIVGSMYLRLVGTAAQQADAEKWLKLSVLAHKRDIGIKGDYPELPPLYTAPNGWGGNAPYKAGINPPGTTGIIGGKERVLDGVRQGDWLRTKVGGKEDRDAKQWPPNVTGYMWEGLTPQIITAAILHQHGLCPFDAANNAIVRAMDANYGTGAMAANNPRFVNPAAGDDKCAPWIVNHFAGTNYPTQLDDMPEKAGYGWMAWYLGNTVAVQQAA